MAEDVLELCNPPAEDMMSHYMADAGKRTAIAKLEHEATLFTHAQAYVEKLIACRDAMAATEQANADRLRGTGEGLGHV